MMPSERSKEQSILMTTIVFVWLDGSAVSFKEIVWWLAMLSRQGLDMTFDRHVIL